METTSKKSFSFGDFELNGANRTLLKRGEKVSLNSKTFDLLFALVENHKQILSKDELLERVWEGQFVEENNLTVQISALRKIFGEKIGDHRFIATIPGKGYKFIANVVSDSNNEKTGAQNLVVNPHLQTENKIVPVEKFSAPENSLIGRSREIEEILYLLHSENVRLVTLTGAGGSGKTSLARTIANGVKTQFPDGIFFIELAAVNKNEIVVSTITQTLGITELPAKPLVETLKEFLREKRTLLVLDNFEQILSAAPLVKEILNDSLLVKILITSRAALRLNIEKEFLVTPLDLPPSNANFLTDDFNEFPAIKLFFIRAKTAKPNFILTDENISSVAEICRRLDGLPLAIELAAARVKLLSPQSILDRLENSLKLLTGGNDLPPRQQTMRNAISWSYDLLNEIEKKLFRQLSIFTGGFTVEGAEKVFENTFSDDQFSNSEIQTLDLLESLVNNNLLTTKEQDDGNVRLKMLEVVREFALECLEQSGEAEIVRHNHSKFFLDFVEKIAPLLHGEKGNEWLDKLDDEHDNLRGALRWSLKNDAETAARIAGGLRFFWLNRSYLSEGLGWCISALEAVENSNFKARSDLILANGVFMRNQGNFEASQKMYERVLEESRVINDPNYIIKANHGLAAIAVLRKDFVSAQPFIEEALAISRELNDETQTAYSLASLGDLEMSRGNFSAARPLIEECFEFSKKLGNNKLLTTTYFNLGTIDYFENSFQSAIFNFAESLRIALEMSNTTMISCALEGFAALALKTGSPEYSAKIAGAAEQLRESISYNLEPAEEIFRNDYLAETRKLLGEKQFIEIYAQGKSLEFSELTALVTKTNFQSSDEDFTEIIIETHKYEKIIIEEIED